MFSHPIKAVMRVGEVTAAGIMKRVRVSPELLGQEDPAKARATPSWKLWVAVLGFVALLALLTVLAA